MIHCNSCGAALTDGLRFCSDCGAAVHSATLSSQTIEEEPNPISDTSSDGDVEPTVRAAHSSTKIIVALGGVIVLLVVIIGVLSLRRNNSPNSPETLAASLRKAIDSGRLVDGSTDDAYSYFAKLNAVDPQHKAISEGKARLLPQLRQIGDAVFKKRAEFSLEILNEEDWVKAQHAYEWAHALESADKAIDAKWKYASANVAKAQGRRAEAESNFRAAVQLDPSWAVSQNDLGYLLTQRESYSEAIPFYQRAISLQPDWDIPYNNMGTVYFRLRKKDDAIQWYRRAIEVNPQWATPHAWLGGLLEERQLFADAIQEYQAVLNLYNPSRDKIKTVEFENKISKLQERLASSSVP